MIQMKNRAGSGNAKTVAIIIILAAVVLVVGSLFMFRKDASKTLPNTTSAQTSSTTTQEGPKAQPKAVATPSVADTPTTQTTAAAATAPPNDSPVADLNGVPQWRGKVLSAATKQPIAKATVSVHRMLNILDDPIPSAPLASVLTDDAGEFTIAASPENSVGMMPSAITLRAEADGYATKIVMVMWQQSAANKTPPEQTIVLDAGGAIGGRIVDEAGGGVAGAAVGSLFLSMPFNGPNQGGAPVEATSAYTRADNAGNFTLAGVPLNTDVRFPVTAAGYIGTVSSNFKAGVTDARVVLKRSNAKIHGKVIAADGTGVPQVRLMAQPLNSAAGGDWAKMMAGMGRARTDDQGNFSMPGLTDGQYFILAMGADMMAPLASQQVTLIDGDDKEVILKVAAELELQGRCLDADTKAPVAGIQFSTAPLSGPGAPPAGKAQSAYSGSDGTFKLSGIRVFGENGFQLYYGSMAGYVADGSQNEGMIYVQTGGVPSSPYKMDILFRKGMKLFGNVYLADGTTPAAKASVNRVAKGSWRNSTDIADAKGAFSFDVLPSESISIRATGETGSGATTAEIPAKGLPAPVKIVLQGFAQVEGYVRDAESKGVAGVQVNANVSAFDGQYSTSAANAESDEKGYYFLDKVGAGTVQIALQLTQWGQAPSESDPLAKYSAPEAKDLTLAAGEYKKDVDFTLEAGNALEGTIVDEADGAPVVGASIYPQMQNSYDQPVTTGPDGKFKIVGLSEDAAISFLNVSHKDYNPVNRQGITLADSPLTIKMRKSGEVKLVVRQHGSPAKAFEYRLMSDNGRQNSQYTSGANSKVTDSPDGTTVLKGIMDGEWRVQVQELSESGARTGRQGSSDFTYTKEKVTDQVVVDLDDGRKLTGQVIREDKTPVVGASVVVGRAASQNWGAAAQESPFDAGTVLTDASGNFTVVGVYPGKQRVEATFEGLQMKETTLVTVPADRDPDSVVITMVTRGAIFGTVTDRAGNPAANVIVQHYYYDTPPQENNQVKTDAQGKYRLENLRAGGHGVQLQAGANTPADNKWEQLKAGEQKQIDFDFSGMIELTGTVTINGNPWDAKQSLFLQAIPGDGNNSSSLSKKPDGGYSVSIKPGRVGLYISVPGVIGNSLLEELDIPAEPKTQTHNFALQVADLTIALVFPRDEDFTPGRISIAHPAQTTAQLDNTGYVNDVTKMTHVVPFIQPGQYKATFQSTDGLWTGSSEIFEAVAGQENIVTVDVKKIAQKIEIGEWTTATVTTTPAAHDFDISANVAADGEYSVMLDYKSGSKALKIDSVALFRNGSQVAIDTHPGWSGYTRRDHVYHLPITGITPGASYSVRVTWSSEADSNGKVYLLTP
ncbi:hypothetical protein BH09SUM1_BH09SUM1_15060 [soil metagenome]